MKIIAAVSADKFLAEVDLNEAARLLGFNNRYDERFHAPGIVVGTEIPIVKFANQARYVREMDREVLKELHDRTERILGEIKDIREVAYKLNVFEDLKEKE